MNGNLRKTSKYSHHNDFDDTKLHAELCQAIVARQPEAFQQQLRATAKWLGVTLVITLVLGVIQRWLGRREHRLHQRAAAESALVNVHDPAPKDYSSKPADPRLWHHYPSQEFDPPLVTGYPRF